MDSRFNDGGNPNIGERDDADTALENIAESPPSAAFNIDSLVTSTSSPKRRSVLFFLHGNTPESLLTIFSTLLLYVMFCMPKKWNFRRQRESK